MKSAFNYSRPLVVAGPSGVGKGTLLQMLQDEFPKFRFAASHTSRAPRPGEIDKVHYNFVTREEFQEKINQGNFFIEHTEYNGNFYGIARQTVKDIMDSGDVCIMDLDINGCQNVKKSEFNPYLVFIEPPEPKFEILKQRLQGRATETPEVVEKRIKRAKDELEWKDQHPDFYDFVLVNDDKNQAYLRLKQNLNIM